MENTTGNKYYRLAHFESKRVIAKQIIIGIGFDGADANNIKYHLILKSRALGI